MPEQGIQIETSWKKVLAEEFAKPYFQEIKHFLQEQKQQGITVYPPGSLIFNAFNTTPFEQVKVVVIGQDPYHGPGQAMGLSFSVPRGIAIPASLRNIYKELQNSLGFIPPNHGDLSYWAEQGVFMLNAILTVAAGQPGSHKNIGWQEFTNAVIQKLSEERTGLIFLLWGRFARTKIELIDEMKHYVLESAHPSPLAGNAFLGNGHFAKTNEILEKQGSKPIDWQLK
ncbi:MAG TPA: uracil-DNA glycosylase [Saprospiraceae bacterium]|nr:uracil-DNA glycosylase [Saprospiraceae bacterium]MCB9269080.1 uracil-DNA glycosylase [Lewinellaceae bacterium]HPG05495.1 uracil-DNA glycosylase [Saprospiraceae bacterium]HPQ98211.1 uracil-DNA glycosylase [Saprospiraceae bacterium]HRV83947.1 uracil-DNA glycosylase [Saprospiraceae bacterium]